MSSTFILKASLTSVTDEVLEFLQGISRALSQDDENEIERLIVEANLPRSRNFQAGKIKKAFCPNTEYQHIKGTVTEKLLHTLKDSTPVQLTLSGKKITKIALEGADVGTADPCVFFLQMLNALLPNEIEASASSLSWEAKWVSKNKTLFIKDYCPLEAGSKIDGEVEKAYGEYLDAQSAAFPKKPYGFLASEVESGCEGKLSKFLSTITARTILGRSYADIVTMLRQLEASDGYCGDSFDVEVGTRGVHEVRVAINWKRCDVTRVQLAGFFKNAKIAYMIKPVEIKDSDGDLSTFGDYEWAFEDIAIRAVIGEDDFSIKLIQRRSLNDLPLGKKLSSFTGASVLEALYWRDLYHALEIDAKNGSNESKEQLKWLHEHPRPGCPNYVDYIVDLHSG
jgi:hypothetical protein